MKRSTSTRFVIAVLAAVALSAATASSASAFAWWVGDPPNNPTMLGPHEQLPINSGGSVKAPVAFKWLKKFEVKCKGVSYNGLFLEGPVFLGAAGIVFEQCEAKKPKHATIVGGKIETAQLTGEIKPGSKVEFVFEPVGGPTLTTFTLEAPKKRKHHRPELKCTYNVSAIGSLSGTLGDAERISTEKTFEFASKSLVFKQSRVCAPMAKVPPGRRSRGPNRFSGSGLTLKTVAGPLSQGAEIRESSSNLTFATEVGNVECEEGILAGSLQNNSSGKDEWTVGAAAATGNFEVPGACKSPGGPVFLAAARLPWFGEFTSKGTNLIRGKGAVGYLVTIAGTECGYQSLSGFSGTNNLGGPMTVTYNLAALELAPGFPAQCPPSARMSGTFAVTSGGEPVEAVTAASEKAEQEEQEEKEVEATEEAEEEAGETVEKSKGTTTYSAFSGWGVL